MNESAVPILCVDDQADALALIKRHLEPEFTCHTASDADTALEMMAQDGPFKVVVCDYLMPGMNGVELLEIVRQRWPDAVRVMLTAMDTLDIAIEALHDGHVYRFVRKPWEASELQRTVREAFDYFKLIESEKTLREQLARTNAELDEKVQDLDEANQLLEYWVEFSPAVLYSLTVDEQIVRASYISKNFLRLTGFERTQAVIETDFWAGLIFNEDRAAFERTLKALIAGEMTHAVIEYRIRHRSGSPVTVVDSLRAVHDGEGATIEIVGAWLDVSSRD